MTDSIKRRFTPVTNMRNLTQFGINALTGEACSYSMRTLCDVNEQGLDLLTDFFGMPKLELEANWNTTVNDTKAIGSLMLVHDIVPTLAQFAFFRLGALAIVRNGQDVTPVFDADLLSRYEQLIESQESKTHSIYRNHNLQKSHQPSIGSRNVHAFSGRVI